MLVVADQYCEIYSLSSCMVALAKIAGKAVKSNIMFSFPCFINVVLTENWFYFKESASMLLYLGGQNLGIFIVVTIVFNFNFWAILYFQYRIFPFVLKS